MDIKEVKDEIKKDEELLVKIFKLEKFINKYKKPIIAIAILTVVILIGYYGYDYYKQQQIINSNILLQKALNNDKKAIEELKKYKNLYSLYLFQKGEYSKIDSNLLKEIKAYKIAMQKGDIASLEDYLNNPNYHILKNSVRLALVRLYLQKGDRKKALIYANEIPADSQFKQFATFLIHYGIVK